MEIKTTMDLARLHSGIERIYSAVQAGKMAHSIDEGDRDLIDETIGFIDRGHLRPAEKDEGVWKVNEWIKKAILLYFRFKDITLIEMGELNYVDKIPVKRWKGSETVRIVPPAVVRRGAYIGRNCVIMPSFVNIGAYVDDGTMVDTWATVGSCAQIGKNVHISGGVGIGGVLEPLQSTPVIIEDNCFIGSRCVVVEGICVEEGSVLGAGVILTGSTKIIDVTGDQPTVVKGKIPKNSVVIPGITSKEFKAGTVGVPCALIIGQRSESTDKKTSLNQALRQFEVSV